MSVMANFIERVLQNPQAVGVHVVNTEDTMSAVEVADMLDQLNTPAQAPIGRLNHEGKERQMACWI